MDEQTWAILYLVADTSKKSSGFQSVHVVNLPLRGGWSVERDGFFSVAVFDNHELPLRHVAMRSREQGHDLVAVTRWFPHRRRESR